MRVENRCVSFAYKCAALLLSSYGLASQTGLLRGALYENAFFYYTILSNVVCWAYFLGSVALQAARLRRAQTTFLPRAKGGVMLCIALTMVVYHFLLGGWKGDLGNKTVHYFVPVLTLLDWVLFDRKGVFRPRDQLLWTIPPLAYMAFALVRGLTGGPVFFGSRYPYPFIDVDALGAGRVCLNCLAIAALYLLAGGLLYLLDRALGRRVAEK